MPVQPRGVTPKMLLEALRAEGAREYGLTGYKEIADWFCRIGYRKSPPGRRTLVRWKKESGCPFVVTDYQIGTQVWTTNLLLMAWAAGQAKARLKRVGRRTKYRFADYEGRAAVEAAIRKKLISGASREPQGTPPVVLPSA